MSFEVLTDAQSGWCSVNNRDSNVSLLRCLLLLAVLCSREMVKSRSFISESSSRKHSQTQRKWRGQAPDRSTDQAKQRILFLRANWLHCPRGMRNMFSSFSGLSILFIYGGNHFSLGNQFTKTLLLPHTDMDGKWQNAQVRQGRQGREGGGVGSSGWSWGGQ